MAAPEEPPAPEVRLERRTSQDPQVLALVGRYVAELDERFPGGFAVSGPDDLVDPDGHYLLATVGGAPAAASSSSRMTSSGPSIRPSPISSTGPSRLLIAYFDKASVPGASGSAEKAGET